MPLETGSIIALVAGSSVLAAVVTQGLSEVRERWKVKRDGAFSGLYLAVALESYASECSSEISDSENHAASDGYAGCPHGNVASLPDYPSSIEWKQLGIKHTTRAMSFRVEVESTRAMLSDYWHYQGDPDDGTPLVREEAAKLGTKALSLAIELRAAWRIEAVSYDSEWNVKSHLLEKVEKYEKARKESEERNRRMTEEMFDMASSMNKAGTTEAGSN